MDQKARVAVVDEFTKPSKAPKIMLISLKAGGVGLNLLVYYVADSGLEKLIFAIVKSLIVIDRTMANRE